MIKGFIEVTDATNNAKRLLNVNHIQEVWGNTIYILLVENDIQDSVNLIAKKHTKKSSRRLRRLWDDL